MNKKALPIVIAVAVVAICILIFSVNKNLRSGTDMPMPAKPAFADEARRRMLQRGNSSGMPGGNPSSATSMPGGP